MKCLLITSLILLVMLFPASTIAEDSKPEVAIIIDDMGNNESDLEASLLPGQLTFAVLPFTPYARAFALKAHHQNKQLLLHTPMQAMKGERLGPGALTVDMSAAEIKLTLQRSLDAVPYVVGINNHMGSYFTQLPNPMQSVMETLQQRQLFFVDSRTSEFTVAERVANELGVATGHRQVFLDNHTDRDYLEQQWQQLIDAAKTNGSAIGIGHPYPQTLAFLREKLPQIDRHGVNLVFVSELVTTDTLHSTRGLLQTSE